VLPEPVYGITARQCIQSSVARARAAEDSPHPYGHTRSSYHLVKKKESFPLVLSSVAIASVWYNSATMYPEQCCQSQSSRGSTSSSRTHTQFLPPSKKRSHFPLVLSSVARARAAEDPPHTYGHTRSSYHLVRKKESFSASFEQCCQSQSSRGSTSSIRTHTQFLSPKYAIQQ
jgi:hypothetical protein